MSGAGELGKTNANSTDADIAALMAANQGDVGSDTSYQTTAGGFSDPGAAEEQTSASPIHDPEPTPEEPSAPEEEHQTILGRPPEESAPEPEVEELVTETEVERDAIIAGLTGAAQSERTARQSIQKALQERESELAEMTEWRARYEPHIAELSDLWPEIEKQAQTLKDTESAKTLINEKLELYRSAALEAGLEIDESRIDLAATLEAIRTQQAALPDLIDQRLARVINTKSDSYDQAQAAANQYSDQERLNAERRTWIANKLDTYYTANPDMKEFETWISSEVERDPGVDMSLVAAPFTKMVSSRRAVARAGNDNEVSVGTSADVGQTPAAEAARNPSAGYADEDYANMSIDAQVAKVRAAGLLGR